jgi:hypothetical protein
MTSQYYGETALIMASERNHDSVVKVLLADKRVDSNMASQYGYTALSEAALQYTAGYRSLNSSSPTTAPFAPARLMAATATTRPLRGSIARPRGTRPSTQSLASVTGSFRLLVFLILIAHSFLASGVDGERRKIPIRILERTERTLSLPSVIIYRYFFYRQMGLVRAMAAIVMALPNR